MAVVVYLDMAAEELEQEWEAFPEVVALDASSGLNVLKMLRSAIDSGAGMELRDRAAQALSLLLATNPEIQSLMASMLEGIAGRSEASAAT